MSLVTRCPRCQRAFQVVLDQLRLHEGLVRCGGCSMVFDGFACLETSLPTLTRLATDSAPEVNSTGLETAPAVEPMSASTVVAASGATPGLPSVTAAASVSPASDVAHDIPRWTSPAAAHARAAPQAPVSPHAQATLVTPDTPFNPAAPAVQPFPATSAAPAVHPFSATPAAPAVHPFSATPAAHPFSATPTVPSAPTAFTASTTPVAQVARPAVTMNPDVPVYPSPPFVAMTATRAIDGAATPDTSPAVMRRRFAEASGDRDQEPSLSSLDPYADEPDAFDQDHPHSLDPNRNPALTVLGESRVRGPGAPSAGRSEPEFLTEEEPANVFIKLLWGLASIAALVLLLGQLVYVYRNELATFSPSLRIVISGVCARVGCDVNFVRHLDKITIDSSSLQQVGGAPQEGQPSELLLRLSMRNRLDRAQSWPSLRLELKDASGTVVVRKDIAPHQYLPSTLIDQPFAPGQEVNLALPLTVGSGLIINGFQLRVFFP
ncbi:MAG: DUF3426 domain-containing protein [Burkholderiaceae bacterium]|nr:DUF3426 domain-containing protein [Burkholderiaceae bacterium]